MTVSDMVGANSKLVVNEFGKAAKQTLQCPDLWYKLVPNIPKSSSALITEHGCIKALVCLLCK